jgi:cell division cycle 14
MAAAAIEVLPGRLYYSPVALRRSVSGAAVLALPADTAREVYVSIEEFCLYYPFFLDFGPAALNRLIRFCGTLRKLLSEGPAAGLNSRRVNLVTGTHMHRRANATYLIAGYLLLELGFSPEEALKPFAGASPPIAPWHDASPGVDPFHLTTLDVLRGIKRARDFGFFSYEDFDVDTYEKYEQVINGDMNWLVQGRFLAFAGPHDPGAKGTDVEEGYHVTTVQDLLPPFINFGIAGVVRLNKKYYDERLFVHVGIKHADLYFLDGSNPPEAILQRFLLLCEETEGAIAVRECRHHRSLVLL